VKILSEKYWILYQYPDLEITNYELRIWNLEFGITNEEKLEIMAEADEK
jgi:hypothetical protein